MHKWDASIASAGLSSYNAGPTLVLLQSSLLNSSQQNWSLGIESSIHSSIPFKTCVESHDKYVNIHGKIDENFL